MCNVKSDAVQPENQGTAVIFIGLINFLGLRTQLIYLLTGWILSDHAIGYAP